MFANELPVVGRMVKAPDVLNAIVPAALTSSEITVMLLLDAVTAVLAFAPKVSDPKLFTMPTLRVPVLSVIAPLLPNKFNTPPCALK